MTDRSDTSDKTELPSFYDSVKEEAFNSMTVDTVLDTTARFTATRNIVIAGDGEEIWTFIKSVLEDTGYDVEVAESGHSSIEKLKHTRPDLIVVGEELTDISGLDFIIKVRKNDPHIKIVFVSNMWRDAEFYQKLRKEFGVSLIVHRPFKPSIFAVQVDSLFGIVEESIFQKSVETNEVDRHLAMKFRYAQILPVRAKQLAEVINSVQSNPNDQRGLTEAFRLAHNLKGSSRSCGFRNIGDLSEQIEQVLIKMLHGDSSKDVAVKLASPLNAIQIQAMSAQLKYSEHPDAANEHANSKDDACKTVILVVTNGKTLELSEENSAWLKILQATTYEEGLETARKKPVDAALIDLCLGARGEALKFAEKIREIKGNDNLPLGFISSGKSDDHLEATRAGGSLVLPKPIASNHVVKAATYLNSIRQGGRPRILIVDDDSDFTQIISSMLVSHGMLIRSLNDPSELLPMLQDFTPDLILLDVMMPVINGFDVCRQLRAMPRWQDTPIVFLTAHSGVDARINAFDAGADDYLPKPIIELELVSRIKLRLERARLLRERADRDLLTGLLSRRAFGEQVQSLLAKSQRHHFKFCISLLDVDHFKNVNDVYGHHAGDQVLTALGQLLNRRFRVEDLRGRWGGEEFALAFPHATSDVMKTALGRLLAEFREKEFGETETFNVSFSAGMATFPEDGTTFKELLQTADQRLYLAKSNGRNTVVIKG